MTVNIRESRRMSPTLERQQAKVRESVIEV